MGRYQFRPLGGTVIGDRCYATVLLDEELWRWLAALDPAHDVAWVHGCELEHGHRGDHHALAYRAGPLSYWLRWDERHIPRISTTDRPDPLAREASPRGEPWGQPQHAEPPTPAEHSSTTDRPDPLAREASPRGEPWGQPQHAEPPTPAEHSSTTAAEPAGSKNSGSQAEALWAIAAALERLADVIVGALNPTEASGNPTEASGNPTEASGRHAARRDKHS